jgi:hypothetical protein
MSADRELLELAAKAAGLINPRYVEATSWGTGISHGEGDDVYCVWNPLADDGDALRLAVSLGLVVDCSRPSAGEPFKLHHFGQENFSDPYPATRRAIVRAAAEIGRAIP